MNKSNSASLIAMIVDRDTPPDLDGDVVVDWDLNGNPITRRMVREFAKHKVATHEAEALGDNGRSEA